MPKFLEKDLKAQYGEDSDVPYKILNSRGYMRGNKETAKGRDAESKHEADMKKKKHKTRRNAQLAALKR